MARPSQRPVDPMVVKIIWFSLAGSMMFYLLALIQMQKVSIMAWPGEETSIFDQVALAWTGVSVLAWVLFKRWASGERDLVKRSAAHIICWALNESVAILGFTATVVSETGNGFFFATNFIIAATAHMAMFPKGFEPPL